MKQSTVRFGIVSDVHFADKAAIKKCEFRKSCYKLAEFVNEMNREGVDFIIELGDFIDSAHNALFHPVFI